jgi:trans-2,3-dihydro-3-hydroxyanthranilate isomerase
MGELMATYDLLQVDAFTNQPLGGNPCAIIFETDGMDDSTMLALAKEMNLSETAFVSQSQVADFGVRFFTPAEEIPLAGHPTIATIHALIETGRLSLKGPLTSVQLELKVGPIQVEIINEKEDIPLIVSGEYSLSESNTQQIVMSQMKPRFLSTHNADDVLPIFGISPNDLIHGVPIQTVSTGTPQLMIPVRDKEVLRRV